MHRKSRWLRAFLSLICVGLLVWLPLVAFHGGWDAADPIASVFGGMAGLGALLWVLLTGNGEPDVEQIAESLARKVLKAQQLEYSRLLSDDIGAVIDLKFTVEAVGAINTGGPGELSEIVDFYRRVNPGRMVITGTAEPGTGRDAGSGKTVALLSLSLGLIRDRSAGDVIPMRISAASWPGRSLNEWMHSHLVEVWSVSRRHARTLLESHLILPMIDGIDELDSREDPNSVSRAAALLQNINDYQHGPQRASVVVTCRFRQYESLVLDDVQARTAAVIRLQPVTGEQARIYLEHRVADSPRGRARWGTVLDALHPAPGITGSVSPQSADDLRRALGTPWRLTLAAVVYQERAQDGQYSRDPDDLIARAADGTIHGHLLDRYLGAAFSLTGQENLLLRRWHYLAFLATYLNGNLGRARLNGRILSSTDIILHELWPIAGPRRPRYAQVGLAALTGFLVAGVAIGVGYASGNGHESLWILAAPLFPIALCVGRKDSVWPKPRRVSLSQLKTPQGWGDLVGALLVTVAIGALSWAWGDLSEALYFAGIIGIGAATGAQGELGEWLLMGDDEPVADPRTPIRVDLLVSMWVFGIYTVFFMAFGWIQDELTISLITGLFFGLGYLASSAFGRYAALLVCVKRQLPWRFAKFMTECVSAGVVRTAGNAYQFRHREFQDHLANNPSGPLS